MKTIIKDFDLRGFDQHFFEGFQSQVGRVSEISEKERWAFSLKMGLLSNIKILALTPLENFMGDIARQEGVNRGLLN